MTTSRLKSKKHVIFSRSTCCDSWGRKDSDMTERVSLSFYVPYSRREKDPASHPALRSYPFSKGESHKYSVTSKGTALFNLRFQFSQYPVKTSRVSAN
jgi:hypothetical protein